MDWRSEAENIQPEEIRPAIPWNEDFTYIPDICKVASADKNDLWVSKAARYGEPRWDLRSLRTERPGNMFIDFDIVNDDGDSLLAPRFALLLESYRDYLYTRLSRATGGKGRPTAGTIVGEAQNADRFLLKWMMKKRISSFAALTPENAEAFLEHARTTPNLHDKDDETARVVSPAGLVKRVVTLRSLFELRRKLNDAIQFDAFNGKSLDEWAGNTWDYKRAHKTDRIPDEVAKDLTNKAISWIRANGKRTAMARKAIEKVMTTPVGKPDVIEAQVRLRDYAIALIQRGEDWPRRANGDIDSGQVARDVDIYPVYKIQRYPTLIATLKQMVAAVEARDVAACTLKFKFKPHLQKSTDLKQELLWPFGFTGDLQELISAETLLVSCCYIVIALLTGMRIHEILWLEVSDDPTKHCLREETVVIEGREETLLWVHGKSSKTTREQDGKPCRWYASPIVKEAIEVLAEAMEHLRKKYGSNRLFLSDAGHNIRNHVYSENAINRSLKRLMVQLGVRPHIVKGQPEVWDITSHQPRRTYARFMAGFKYGIKFVQEQFQHASYVMSHWYTLGDLDDELYGDIQEEAAVFPMEMARGLLESDSELGGGGAPDWETMRLKYAGMAGEDREEYLRHVASTMVMYDNGIGVCVYNPRKAKCRGGAGSGSTCVPDECGNAVIDVAHSPIHIITLANVKKMLRQPYCQAPAQQAVLNEKLERSKKILRPLNGDRLEQVKHQLEEKGLVEPGLALDLD